MTHEFKVAYMTKMKHRYAQAKTRARKSAIISECIQITGFTRKYVIRLLTGRRTYRKHRGHRPSFSAPARKMLARIWRSLGMMCPLYLHAIMDSAIQDFGAVYGPIPDSVAAELRRMSVSTMYRILRLHRFGPRLGNKRSGSVASLAALIPAGPGYLDENDDLGVLQADTVALCGGDMRESFFWVLHVTDAQSQWSAAAPVWNRGSEAICRAIDHILEQLPFRPTVIHFDNGTEFINHNLFNHLQTLYPNMRITRSRPGKCNDNNRIEQKNGSIIRALFGDLRFDDYSQLDALTELCDQWSMLYNMTIPCRRQISKKRRTDVKGIAYTRYFDAPLTPWQRVNQITPLPPPEPINAILLRRSCEKSLKRLYSTQESQPLMGRGPHAAPAP